MQSGFSVKTRGDHQKNGDLSLDAGRRHEAVKKRKLHDICTCLKLAVVHCKGPGIEVACSSNLLISDI